MKGTLQRLQGSLTRSVVMAFLALLAPTAFLWLSIAQRSWLPKTRQLFGRSVTALVFTPNMKLLCAGYTAQLQAQLVSVDARTLESVKTLPVLGAVQRVAFTPDARIVAAGLPRRVELRETATGHATWASSHGLGEGVEVLDMAVHPQGKTVAMGYSSFNSGGCLVWEVRRAHAEPLLLSARGFTQSPVLSVTYSRDGTRLVGGSFNGAVGIWKTQPTVKLLWVRWPHADDSTTAVSISAGNELVASTHTSGTLCWWNARTGQPIEVSEGPAKGRSNPVLAFSPDSRTLAVGDAGGTIVLWNTQTFIKERVIMPHNGAVTALAWASDNSTMASGHENGAVTLWRAR